MREILIDIKGYEGLYKISNFGYVFSMKRNLVLKEDKIKGGYKRITLSKNGITKRFMVHRLVAEYFIPNKENKPCVHHLDHNTENNNFKNLEWVTHFENEKYNFIDGTRKIEGFKLTEDDVVMLRQMKSTGKYTNKQLSKIFNINERNVRRIYNRETYKHIL